MGATPEQRAILDHEDKWTPILSVEQMLCEAANHGIDTIAKHISRTGRNPFRDTQDIDNLLEVRRELLEAAHLLREWRMRHMSESPYFEGENT